MASASSNSTSGWPRVPCVCGCGLCIPNKAGPNGKYPGRHYYKCPRSPPCKRWIGWCDEHIDNVADSGDNKPRQLNGPFDDLKVNLHSLTECDHHCTKCTKHLVAIGDRRSLEDKVVADFAIFNFLKYWGTPCSRPLFHPSAWID